MNRIANTIHNEMSSAIMHFSNFDSNSISKIYVFPQLFNSTALCFGGGGGRMMTWANVICMWNEFQGWGGVYVAGKMYKTELTEEQFNDIVKKQKIEESIEEKLIKKIYSFKSKSEDNSPPSKIVVGYEAATELKESKFYSDHCSTFFGIPMITESDVDSKVIMLF